VLTGEEPLDPPIKSLFVYNSNPAIVVPQQEKIIQGLQREDLFTVVSEQFLTDTARYADIILPATTQLEQFDMMFSWGHLYLSLNQQAIAPLGESVSNTELFRRLAGTMASMTASGSGATKRWQWMPWIGRARLSRESRWNF
jgi:anaerobic selenocysteine-containing dehydrogenase